MDRVGTVTAQDLDEAPQWIKVGDEWHAPTRFGRAVIVEHRKEPNPWIIGQQLSRYTTRIEHPTGAVLPCGLGREPQDFPTFEEAHDYILLQLDDLANWPDTDATSLGNAEANYPLLEFTLAVCASALSVKADPIHRERFEHIKSDLFLRLD